jgi:hypothetical protein
MKTDDSIDRNRMSLPLDPTPSQLNPDHTRTLGPILIVKNSHFFSNKSKTSAELKKLEK